MLKRCWQRFEGLSAVTRKLKEHKFSHRKNRDQRGTLSGRLSSSLPTTRTKTKQSKAQAFIQIYFMIVVVCHVLVREPLYKFDLRELLSLAKHLRLSFQWARELRRQHHYPASGAQTEFTMRVGVITRIRVSSHIHECSCILPASFRRAQRTRASNACIP